MKMKLFWFLLPLVLIAGMLSVRAYDDPYGRSINGDGKGYYAYLPALFIYGDPSYAFIHAVEKNYYPSDGSQFKHFLNEQPNGRHVNKTFPGLSILYAPFFFIAYFLSFLFGLPVDGYSALFQWGIAFSHVFYFMFGVYFLQQLFKRLRTTNGLFVFVILSLCFASNCWYYIVYDHSVSHIHSFFLACILLYLMCRWLQDKSPHIFGIILMVISLIIITRPTNVIMVFFLFFLSNYLKVSLKNSFCDLLNCWKVWLPYAFISGLLVFIPLILWKWQTGYWLVYSYGKEGFDFLHPHFIDFLFSFKKGWLLWSPWILVLIGSSLFFLFKQSRSLFILFLAPILLAVYVLSSWWCWTFGTGFGQRPMIEFLPFIGLGFALAVRKFNVNFRFFTYLSAPFICLSLIQGYQINNSILRGGETTSSDYWQHFLQLKRDAPSVDHRLDAFVIKRFEDKKFQEVSKVRAFSSVVTTDSLMPGSYVIVKLKVAGKHNTRDLRLVVSSANGDYYKAFFFGEYLYNDPRIMEFLMRTEHSSPQAISCYVWNGGSLTKAKIELLAIDVLKKSDALDALLSVLNEEQSVHEK